MKMTRRQRGVDGDGQFDDDDDDDEMRFAVVGRGKQKRRRTSIVDGLEAIRISDTTSSSSNPTDGSSSIMQGKNRAPFSNRGGENNCSILLGGHGSDEFMIDAADDDDDDHKNDNVQEEAERKVMRALVYGDHSKPSSQHRHQDPVEKKLEALIRGSMERAKQLSFSSSQCDMNIEPSYSRPSPSYNSSSRMNHDRGYDSLPDEFEEEEEETETMDISPL